MIEADDELVSSSLTLDGAPFVPGTVVSAEGLHTFLMSAEDVAGRVGAAALSFTIDVTPPSVQVQGVVAGDTSATPVAPTAIFSDHNLLTTSLTLDGQPFASGAIVDVDGPHVLIASATDRAGNTTTLEVPFAVDVAAPRIVFSGFTADALHPPPVRPAFTIEDTSPTAVTALLDGKEFGRRTFGEEFIAGALVGDGDHRIEVRAVDALGRLTTAAASFAVDATPPRVRVLGIVDGGIYPTGVAAVIEIDEPRLSEAEIAGNETALGVAFTLDQTAPQVSVANITDGQVFTAPIVPDVVVVDDNPGTTVIALDGRALNAGEAVAAPGLHRLEIKAVDAAGNIGEATVSFTVVVDLPFSLLVTRGGAPATGDRVRLFSESGSSTELVAVVDEAGIAALDVPAGRYRARVEHLWQRFFTPASSVPGGRVIFQIPDEPVYESTLYVDPAADDDGDGGEDDPFSSLPSAVQAAGFNTLIKVAGGTINSAVTLTNGVTVKGGHDARTWRFAPTTQSTVLRGDVVVQQVDAALTDVVIDGGALALVAATGVVRDVIVRDSPANGVLVVDGDCVLANLLIEGSAGAGVQVTGGQTRVEHLTVVDSVGAAVAHDGGGSVARVIAVNNGGAITASDAVVVVDNLEGDVGFVTGPLHDRYLAQRRGGQDVDSPAVDHASASAASLDLRGRTTSKNGAPDVGAADVGYHAWPVAPDVDDVDPPEPQVPAPWCAGAPGSTAPIVLVALLLLRRRRERL